MVVINAAHIEFTGNKLADKVYSRYSGYPDGLKLVTAGTLLQKNPARIVRSAVSGMLPKNKLRDKRLARLHIYPGDVHPYQSKFRKINN